MPTFQPWYTHNQAEQIAARLVSALGTMKLPVPGADEITSLVDALVSVRPFHKDEDWRWEMPASTWSVTGIILTVGTFVLLCENNTQKHPLTAELHDHVFSAPLTTAYDVLDNVEYIFGMGTAMNFLAQLLSNGSVRLTHLKIGEMKSELMSDYGKGNLAWRHGQAKIFAHLGILLSNTRQSVVVLEGKVFAKLIQVVLLEAFAAEKPKDFDVNALVADLVRM